MLFIIECRDGPDGLAKRPAVRPDHLEHARSAGDAVKFAGPLLNSETGDPAGSFFLFEAETQADAQAFSDADPYKTAGVFAEVRITPVRGVLGDWLPGGVGES